MTKGGWIAKGLLALAGVLVGAFVGEDLIGGALGWAAAGAIVAGSAWPLFRALLEWRRSKESRTRR